MKPRLHDFPQAEALGSLSELFRTSYPRKNFETILSLGILLKLSFRRHRYLKDIIMESSRIYVQNLPLGINSNQMRHHFSKTSSVTDIRHIPDRRMCYVGYQSTADAAKAVEYFNKSFIQTSRLVVKMARPVR